MKLNKDSKLTISEDAGKVIVRDLFGNPQERMRLLKTVVVSEVNLGSIINPNKKIVSFKWDIPPKKGIRRI